MREMFIGIFMPLVGTTLGAACVFFMKQNMKLSLQRALTGFAAGVMVGAAVFSLLLPALESGTGKTSFIPVVVGLWLGIFFLLLLDKGIPHLHLTDNEPEGPKSNFGKITMLALAVALHNVPEGMAVGVVYAGLTLGDRSVTKMGALALAIGIALQNFPEGAIISMPMHLQGVSKKKAFIYGVLSGAVEPIAAILTILVASFIVPAMPYLLSFAAGAMIYVVVEELIPEMSEGEHSNVGTILFAIGFSMMIVLDSTLG